MVKMMVMMMMVMAMVVTMPMMVNVAITMALMALLGTERSHPPGNATEDVVHREVSQRVDQQRQTSKPISDNNFKNNMSHISMRIM